MSLLEIIWDYNLDSAPFDIPLLSDEGIVIKRNEIFNYYKGRDRHDKGIFERIEKIRWYYCNNTGYEFNCVEEGRFEAYPTCWDNLPDIMRV